MKILDAMLDFRRWIPPENYFQFNLTLSVVLSTTTINIKCMTFFRGALYTCDVIGVLGDKIDAIRATTLLLDCVLDCALVDLLCFT